MYKELVLKIVMLSITYIVNNVQRDVMIKNERLKECLSKKVLPLTGNLIGVETDLVKFKDISDDLRNAASEFLDSLDGKEILDLKNFIALTVSNKLTSYHRGAVCMLLGLAKKHCADANFDNVRETLERAGKIADATDDVLILTSMSLQAIVRDGKMTGSVGLLGKYSLRTLSSKKVCGMFVLRSVRSSVPDSQDITSHEDFIIRSALVNISLLKRSIEDTKTDKIVFSNTPLIPMIYAKLATKLDHKTSATLRFVRSLVYEGRRKGSGID